MVPEPALPPDISAIPPRRGRRWLILACVAALLLVAAGVSTAVYLFGKGDLSPSGGLYFAHRMELPVPLILQGDPAWGQRQIARSRYNIAQVGCALTSTCMVLKYYGIDTDPGRMNAFLQDHGGFNEDNDLIWEGPPMVAPDQVRHVYEDAASYYLIDSNLKRNNPVIVKLRLKNNVPHFVVVMGKDGFDYLIRDPSKEGLRKGVYPLKDLGSKILGLRYYEKLPQGV